MDRDPRTSVQSAYDLKLREHQRKEASETGECLDRMRATNRPGDEMVALKQVGGKIVSAMVAHCEAAIPELIRAHLDAGDRDAVEIAASLRTGFVDVALRALPGARLYASLRGAPGEKARGLQVRQSEDAVFSVERASLLRSVDDYVIRELTSFAAIAKTQPMQRVVGFDPKRWPKVERQVQELHQRVASASTEEQYQTVGLLCREVLISVAQEVFEPSRHRTEEAIAPSNTDVKRMLDAILAVELVGAANEEARAHAKASVRLALALQHRRTADFRTAALCAEATLSTVAILAILERTADEDPHDDAALVRGIDKVSSTFEGR